MNVRKRTDNDFEKDAKTTSHGVLGPTVLLPMLFFLALHSFSTVVDYMHAVCLGVLGTTTNLWSKGIHSS